MEPLFEVRYTSNQRMIREFARKYSVGPRIPLLIVFWAIYAVYFVFTIVDGVVWEEDYLNLTMGVVMLFVSFLPNWYARQTIKNTKKQNDGILPETIVTFSDTIALHEGIIDITIEYRKIIRTVHLKNSYVLMMGKKNGVMIEPSSFTKGNFEDFKQFIREKCPEISVVE